MLCIMDNYEKKLREILIECMDKWWSYNFLYKENMKYIPNRHCGCYGVSNWEEYEDNTIISIHEMFSADSGIMEFIEWDKPETYYDDDYWWRVYDHICHIFNMSLMDCIGKCKYFIKHASVK